MWGVIVTGIIVVMWDGGYYDVLEGSLGLCRTSLLYPPSGTTQPCTSHTSTHIIPEPTLTRLERVPELCGLRDSCGIGGNCGCRGLYVGEFRLMVGGLM